jgi:2-polyprenyl-3-methyl-5-hydroxy-6-metoxy-1,4-benzoquinol methylase
MTRIAYLRRSVAGQFMPDRFKCPNCGCERSAIVDRKLIVTQLRRCANCQLMFRTPTDDPAANADFYEHVYKQGFATHMPSDEALDEMKRSGFFGSENGIYSYYIEILAGLGLRPGAKLFDYGCSWGYGSFQLSQAGYDVVAYDVAPSRSRYAKEKLSIRTIDDMDQAGRELCGQFDCFFSAHVIEHVPAPAKAFAYARQLLVEGGLFVSFTPNGSSGHRAASRNWSRLWGEVHPNFIDDKFLDYSFRLSPRSVGSSPVTNAALPQEPVLLTLNQLKGSELFFAARKTGDTWG